MFEQYLTDPKVKQELGIPSEGRFPSVLEIVWASVVFLGSYPMPLGSDLIHGY